MTSSRRPGRIGDHCGGAAASRVAVMALALLVLGLAAGAGDHMEGTP